MNCSFLLLLLMLPIFLIPSFATVNDFTTDKTLYRTDDDIVISGNVDYDPEFPPIIIQIITPSGTGLAHIDSVIPNFDGSFTKIINAGGPTWSENGKYTIKISYVGNLEKSVEYEKSSEYVSPTTPSTMPKTTPNINDGHSFIENPKMRILGFPAFDKSPQYYIDRYNDESTYKSWFDSQIAEKTIYDVLGFYTYIPDWIKFYAQNWAIGGISDTEFMSGLNFMIQNKIIVLPNLDNNSLSTGDVPSWFRNTALWWSSDLISQQEFINSIKYLIREDIISIE